MLGNEIKPAVKIENANIMDVAPTILYLMGLEHTKLTYRYSGRDFRLTDVAGNVLHELIA